MRLIISDTAVKALISGKNKKLAETITSMLADGVVDLSTIEVPLKANRVTSGGERLRLGLPKGYSEREYKACGDCFREAIKAGESEEQALRSATHPISDFGTYRAKSKKGLQVSSYCRAHQRRRSLLSMVDPNSLSAKLKTLRERADLLEQRQAELSGHSQEAADKPKARLIKTSTNVS